MKRYKYIKSNAFTAGASLGNPAACVFTGEETLSPDFQCGAMMPLDTMNMLNPY